MHTDHRLEAADPLTMVVMIVDRTKHWELAHYDATKNALGFDPNQHAAEVAMWMDPFSESKIKRINGKIALGATAARGQSDGLFDEAGRMRRAPGSTRTAGGNRPSSATRKRRKHAEPVLVQAPPVAPEPDIFPQSAGPVPSPIMATPPELEQEQVDAFTARWQRVNAAAAAREADSANVEADRTFILPATPAVAEVPKRPPVGRAAVHPTDPSLTEEFRVPFGERGKLYGKSGK